MFKLLILSFVTLGFAANTWADQASDAAIARQSKELGRLSAEAGNSAHDAEYWKQLFNRADRPQVFDRALSNEYRSWNQYFELRGDQSYLTGADKHEMARAVATQEFGRDLKYIEAHPAEFKMRVNALVVLRERAMAVPGGMGTKEFDDLKKASFKLFMANRETVRITNHKALLTQVEQLTENLKKSKAISLVSKAESIGSSIAGRVASMVSNLKIAPPVTMAVVGGVALTGMLLKSSSAHAEPANTVGGSAPSQLEKHDDDAFGTAGAR